eukprot:9462485-Alexandrium_andersonii.AAC.1
MWSAWRGVSSARTRRPPSARPPAGTCKETRGLMHARATYGGQGGARRAASLAHSGSTIG